MRKAQRRLRVIEHFTEPRYGVYPVSQFCAQKGPFALEEIPTPSQITAHYPNNYAGPRAPKLEQEKKPRRDRPICTKKLAVYAKLDGFAMILWVNRIYNTVPLKFLERNSPQDVSHIKTFYAPGRQKDRIVLHSTTARHKVSTVGDRCVVAPTNRA